jgi:hypothetical protein
MMGPLLREGFLKDSLVPETVTLKVKIPKKKDGEKIKCTFDDCNELFDNATNMRKHKKYRPQHDYCNICDEDFVDWDSYSAHNARWSGMDYFGKTVDTIKNERIVVIDVDGDFKGKTVFYREKQKAEQQDAKKGKKYGELKHHDWGCKFCGELFKSRGGRDQHLNQVCYSSFESPF